MAEEISSGASPYSAPRSAVADVEAPAIRRPARVQMIVRLLWAAFAISLVSSVLTLSKSSPQMEKMAPAVQMGYMIFVISFTVIVGAFVAWVNVAVGRGRNWARIACFLLNLMWIPTVPYLYSGVRSGQVSVLEVLLNLANFILSIAACYWLLSAPVKAWFMEMKHR